MTRYLIFRLRNLAARKKGQGMVEYAMVISFVALLLILALKTLGLNLIEFFTAVAEKVTTSVTST